MLEAMRSLSVEPRPHGCQHLQDELFRARAGQYRIVVAVFYDDVVVVVYWVARRTEKIWRDLEKLIDFALRELLS